MDAITRAWRWDTNMGRYRDADTGKFLAREAIYGMVEKSINAGVVVTDHLATSVSEGTIGADAWHAAMKGEIKREYVRQYLLANGGRYSMTPADWGRLGPMIRQQYRFLDGFASSVAAGELTEKQIRARAASYINSAREAYETAHSLRARQYGMEEVAWRLGLSGETCATCDSFASAGWQRVEDTPFGGAIPGSGDSECLSNCKCFLEYRNSSGEIY